jgi:hypothetical protein
LLGERDGWSEIRLSDGRRAWVPAGEIARSEEPPQPKASPSLGPNAPIAADLDNPTRDLAAEVARLRSLVDDFEARRTNVPAPPTNTTFPLPEGFVWMIGGASLIVGIFVGSAWERRSGRRDRSLRF